MKGFIPALVVLALIAPSVFAQPQALADGVEPSFNRDGGLIAYASIAGGYRDIFVIDGVGMEKRLTTDIHWNGQPAFTPDDKVVFVSERSGNRELWSVDLKGENLKQLTEGGGWKSDPSVSPAGEIAFTSGRHPNLDIYILEGVAVRRLTYLNDEIHSPVWSHDGKQIAFVKKGDLMIINADGSGLEKIASDVHTRGLSWSNDGRILYLTRKIGYDLWSIDVGNPSQKTLIYEGVTDSWEVNPAIDSRGKIAFSTDKDGFYRIYVIETALPVPAVQPNPVAAPVLAPAPALTPSETALDVPEPTREVSEEISEEKTEDDLDSLVESEIELPDSSNEWKGEIALPDSGETEAPNPALPDDGVVPIEEGQLHFFILASSALFVLILERQKSRRPKYLV